jgi:peroxidase
MAPPLAAAVGLLLAAAVSARSLTTDLQHQAPSSNATTSGGLLSAYFHLESCPQLETLVRANVDAALRQNVRLTAGLLRLFFHDCFPQVHTYIRTLSLEYVWFDSADIYVCMYLLGLD